MDGEKNKKTILLVEDEAILAMTEKMVLEKFGYTAIIANTGEKAVEIINATTSIDLILMDIDLGKGIDGTEAAAQILKDHDIPIVFCSSHTEPEIVEKTEKITSYGYVVKSSSNTVLDASIKMAFKLFEAKLQIVVSQKILGKTVANIGDVIVIIDAEGTNKYKSPNISQIFGWNPEDLIGQSAWDTVHPDDLEASRQFLGSIASKPNSQGTINLRYRRKDGQYVWIEMTLVNLLDDPDIQGLLGNYHDITERKEAEEKLKTSEEKYRLQFQNMNSYNSIYEVVRDREGKPQDFRFLSVNQAYENFVGKKSADLIGKTLLEIYPHTEQYWIDKMREVVLTEKPQRFENYSRELNTYTEIHMYIPQKGQLAMTSANISERKQAEEKLKETNTLLRIAGKAAKLGGWSIILATKQVIWSDEVAAIHEMPAGFSPLLQDALDFYAPEWHQKIMERFNACAQNGTPYDEEMEIITASRKRVWVRTIGEAVRDGEGTIIKVQGAFQDITEQKNADYTLQTKNEEYEALNEELRSSMEELQAAGEELQVQNEELAQGAETLRKSEERYRMLLSNLEAGVVVHAADTSIIMNNERASELLGLSDAQLKGKVAIDPVWKFIDQNKMPLPLSEYPVNRIARDKKPLKEEIYGVFRGDKKDIVWVTVNGFPVMNKSGSITEILVSFIDITGRRLAEQNTKALLAEKELILKEVNHRIKNNMSMMEGFLQLQAAGLSDPATVAALEDAGKRMKTMRLLYEKLYHSANFTELPMAVYISPLIDEILTNFPRGGEVHVEKDIGSFILDAKRLQSLGIIINELLTNIMKYAFTDKKDGIITVSATLADGRIAVIVQDNGIGIPASVDFEHTTGFGLTLVHALAEQIDGKIRIERGGGTRIVLEFEA